MSMLPRFATVDPFEGMNTAQPGIVQNLLSGRWVEAPKHRKDIPDPLTGDVFLKVPDTTELGPFLASLKDCPKSGLHNPHKEPQRYVKLGEVCAAAAALLAQEDTAVFFAKLIQRVMPKSWSQCMGEVTVTRVRRHIKWDMCAL